MIELSLMSLVDVCVVIPVLFSWFKSKEYTHLKKAIKPFVNRRVMWPSYLVVLWIQRNTIHKTTYLYPNERKGRILLLS